MEKCTAFMLYLNFFLKCKIGLKTVKSEVSQK